MSSWSKKVREMCRNFEGKESGVGLNVAPIKIRRHTPGQLVLQKLRMGTRR